MSSRSKVRIKAVAHDSDEYWEALALRDVLLRRPLGLEFSDQDVAEEADQVHVVAAEKGEVVGTLLLRGEAGGLVHMRQVAVAAKRQGRGIGRDLGEVCGGAGVGGVWGRDFSARARAGDRVLRIARLRAGGGAIHRGRDPTLEDAQTAGRGWRRFAIASLIDVKGLGGCKPPPRLRGCVADA